MSSDGFDEADCLGRVREHDQLAARAFVERLYPGVIRTVRAHLPRRDAEEDLAQEIFMKMFAQLDQYHGDVPLEHWVSRIAVRTCYDRLRAQQRRPELRQADLSQAEAERLERSAVVSEDPDVADASGARETVEQLLAKLCPSDRLLITLLELEERSIAEIRAITGWNASLIKVRAFRARQKLRKEWERRQRMESSR